MGILSKLFGASRQPPTIVDAMMGICVHDPDVFIEPPSNVKQTAGEALRDAVQNGSLSPTAKVGFAVACGAMAFAESEKAAAEDLPKQLRGFMKENGLSLDDYDLRTFSEELRADLKILWAYAAKRQEKE